MVTGPSCGHVACKGGSVEEEGEGRCGVGTYEESLGQKHLTTALAQLFWVVATQIFLEFSPRNLGKIFTHFDGCIFFKGVETTN